MDIVPLTNRSRPTQGWKSIAPRKPSLRRELYKKCGSRCFLRPKDLKFPICASDLSCKAHCSGIASALVRAGQHKYTSVKRKANRLYYGKCSSYNYTDRKEK